jgi:hypothetical protein
MAGKSSTQSNANLNAIKSRIESAINVLKSDEKISQCINGRDVSQVSGGTRGAATKTVSRFPNLMNGPIMLIYNAGIMTAKKNYDAKYKKFMAEAMQIVDATIAEKKAAGQASMCLDASQLPETN